MRKSQCEEPEAESALFQWCWGLLFWQVGAAQYLQEKCAWKDMPIIGASAGSLSGLYARRCGPRQGGRRSSPAGRGQADLVKEIGLREN